MDAMVQVKDNQEAYFIYPSAKPITILPYSRKRVVCGARADLVLEGPARNGTKENYDRSSARLWAAGYSSEIRGEN